MRKDFSALKILTGISFDAVLTVDDDRRYLTTNARGTALLGASRDDVLSSAIDDFTSVQFAPLLPGLWNAMERDGALSGAYEIRRGDGSIGWIEFATQRDVFDGQHLIVARNLPRDAAAPAAGFALLNPRDGDIEEASPECCRLLGRSRSALLADGLRVFGGRRQGDETLAALRKLADGEQAAFTFRCRVARPNGGLQWLVVTLRPVFGGRRRPIRILLEAVPLVSAPSSDSEILTTRER